MGLMSRPKIDPKIAQDIEEDMAELDGKPKARKQSVSSEDCSCVSSSAFSAAHPGLLDEFTKCPECKGTGKVAVLG